MAWKKGKLFFCSGFGKLLEFTFWDILLKYDFGKRNKQAVEMFMRRCNLKFHRVKQHDGLTQAPCQIKKNLIHKTTLNKALLIIFSFNSIQVTPIWFYLLLRYKIGNILSPRHTWLRVCPLHKLLYRNLNKKQSLQGINGWEFKLFINSST